MSIFGRLAAGVGAGAAQIANKYIDEEITTNRAKLLADLQYQNTVKLDQYQQSPERQAGLRENERQSILDRARAARGAELEGLNDTTLRGAQRTRADEDAADVTRRKAQELRDLTPAQIAAANAVTTGTAPVTTAAEVARVQALSGPEAKAAGLKAEATAKAEAKYREAPAGSARAIQQKMAGIEAVLGRKLTQDEKVAMLGLKTGDDSEAKLIDKVIEESVKAGTLQPGEVPAVRNRMRGEFASIRTTTAIQSGISKARADGKLPEAVAELRSRGLDDAQLKGLGLSDADLGIKKQEKPGFFERAKASATAPADMPEQDRALHQVPPDSPAGRKAAAVRERQREDEAKEARGRQEATAAFEALPPGDVRAAVALQDSELFKYLSLQQKTVVQNRVMGR